MKKNIKTIASLAFVALLAASCDGSNITKEEAQKRAKNMADHESETATEVLEKGVHLSLKTKSVVKEVKSNASMDIYFANNYFHVAVSGKTEGGSTEGSTKSDIYFGKKDEKFYAINASSKEYAVLESATIAKFTDTVTEAVDSVLNLGSSDSLKKMLATFPQSSSTTEINGYKHAYEMKSKGEGHLCLKSTTSYTDKEDKKSEIVYKLVVDNYRFASYDFSTSTTGVYASVKASAKYSISKSLPSVSGMKEVASASFEFNFDLPDLGELK